MKRMAGVEASPELAESAECVERGERVWVELENGHRFLAVPATEATEEEPSQVEWCARVDALAGKYSHILASSDDLLESRLRHASFSGRLQRPSFSVD
ncbi:MAG: hypothetical protein AB1714_30310 [Acidobacteriota bacterium]